MPNQPASQLLLPQIQVSVASFAGRKAENQDTILLQTLLPLVLEDDITAGGNSQVMAQTNRQQAWLLAAVADGVSACQAPKVASDLAIRTFTRHMLDEQEDLLTNPINDQSPDTLLQALAKSVQYANDKLYFSEGIHRPPPLLSTLSGMLVTQQTGFVFHTGDSRVYRYRQLQLEVLTQDHRHHKGRDKGALSAALGADAHVNLQFLNVPIFPDDVYLIMTDGVYEHINDEEMQVLLRGLLSGNLLYSDTKLVRDFSQNSLSQNTLNDLPDKLCRAAIENGSTDNVSCVVLAVANPSGQALTNVNLQTNSRSITLKLPPVLIMGDTLDNFTITQVLQNTARSSIYLATDNQAEPNNQRILKVPSAYFEDDSDYLRQFLKEEKIGLGFSHDSLLKFYPKSPNSPYLYHVTEYVAGTNLREFLDDHPPLSVAQTHEIISRIGLALRVMHRNYVLHQDVKPENIILTPTGDIKLIDFGSAGSLLLKNALAPPAGDLHYTAPEYYNHAPKGIYSDIFSLGVVAYEMLTGKQPFEVKTLTNPQENISFTDARALRPDLPFWVNDVLVRAMHPDGNSRYQSIGEFLSDLDSKSHQSEQNHSIPLIKRQPVLVWQSISGMLLLLLIISWVFLRK